MNKIKSKILLISLFSCFFISLVIFLLHYLVVGQAVYGDGRFYFSYAHSLYFDHDLDVTNQLQHHFNPANNNLISPKKYNSLPDYPNQSVGTGLVWLPVFPIVDFSTQLINFVFKTNLPNHGFSDNYQISLGVYSIILVTIGLVFTYKITANYFSSLTSLLAVATLWLTTNLFFYSSVDVLNTHSVSFFLAAFIIYLLLKVETGFFLPKILFLGWLLGLSFSVREHDLVTFIPVFFGLPFLYPKFKKLLSPKILAIISIGFFLGIFLQLYYWSLYFQSFFSPRLSQSQWHFGQFKIWPILFGFQRGIIFYSPSFFLAIYGFLTSRIKFVKLALISVFAQLILISGWWAWHQGESYGIRMLISTYPLLSLGYASVIDKVKNNFKRYLLLLAVLTLFNLAMIFRFLLKETSANDAGIDPTTLQRIQNFIQKIH